MTVKQRKQQLKARMTVIILIILQLCWMIPCGIKYHEEYMTEPAEEIETTGDVLRFRIDDPVDEPTEVTVEPLEIGAVEQPAKESLGEFKLTAYCSCRKCTGDGDGITASGTVAAQGRTVAVDPGVIPYGTVLVINGHEYMAEDNGGKWIEGKEIDIFFDSHEEAWDFGIKYAEVFAYDN